MTLGGQVDDRPGSVRFQQVGYQASVADIAVDELMTAIVGNLCQVVLTARIGQFVEVDDRSAAIVQPFTDKIAADKTGAPGNQDRLCFVHSDAGAAIRVPAGG